mmetsp:Transcript_112567/g.359551  ORF Transcript_112567/g.359551 Transcript_112567/m.359551 type:complete len:503 (+) Transcript_112567:784-2292(+)
MLTQRLGALGGELARLADLLDDSVLVQRGVPAARPRAAHLPAADAGAQPTIAVHLVAARRVRQGELLAGRQVPAGPPEAPPDVLAAEGILGDDAPLAPRRLPRLAGLDAEVLDVLAGEHRPGLRRPHDPTGGGRRVLNLIATSVHWVLHPAPSLQVVLPVLTEQVRVALVHAGLGGLLHVEEVGLREDVPEALDDHAPEVHEHPDVAAHEALGAQRGEVGIPVSLVAVDAGSGVPVPARLQPEGLLLLHLLEGRADQLLLAVGLARLQMGDQHQPEAPALAGPAVEGALQDLERPALAVCVRRPVLGPALHVLGHAVAGPGDLGLLGGLAREAAARYLGAARGEPGARPRPRDGHARVAARRLVLVDRVPACQSTLARLIEEREEETDGRALALPLAAVDGVRVFPSALAVRQDGSVHLSLVEAPVEDLGLPLQDLRDGAVHMEVLVASPAEGQGRQQSQSCRGAHQRPAPRARTHPARPLAFRRRAGGNATAARAAAARGA